MPDLKNLIRSKASRLDGGRQFRNSTSLALGLSRRVDVVALSRSLLADTAQAQVTGDAAAEWINTEMRPRFDVCIDFFDRDVRRWVFGPHAVDRNTGSDFHYRHNKGKFARPPITCGFHGHVVSMSVGLIAVTGAASPVNDRNDTTRLAANP